MIHNNWKKLLLKAGMSQNAIADAVGVNRGHFSRICNGEAVADIDVLECAAKRLKCDIRDIYDDTELRVMYQIGGASEPPKKKRYKTVTVRIREDVAAALDGLVEDGAYASRNEAANSILAEGVSA